jgi:hypothetical protein
MANTLTSLAADIYNARDIVAREAVGVINSALVNTGSQVAAFGDTVRSFVTAEPTLNTSYTPAMTIPNSDDQTVSNLTCTLDQVANVKIGLTGEEIRHLDNGAGAERVRVDMFAQAFRKITNTIETYGALQIAKGASRATGTAGTTPFASTHAILNDARQILLDNGAPVKGGGLSCVLNSSAGTNFRNLSNLFKVNEAGSSDLLRKGELTMLSNFSIKESAGVAATTAGTGASYLINNGSGYAIGATALTLDTGSGTILAGDIITIGSHKYVVASALASNVVTIAAPGLRAAVADNAAVTVNATSTRNLAFDRSAAELVMRAPAQPYGGDAAVDRMTVGDPVSGLNFEIAEYKGYGKVMYDITTFYTVKVWKPEFAAIILG